MTVIFVIIGESFADNVGGFVYEYYNVSFSSSGDVSDMDGDIIGAAKKDNVKVFTVVDDVKSTLEADMCIYGSNGAEDYINKNDGIHAGKYKSAISGDTKIMFKDLKDFRSSEKKLDFHIIGDESDVMRFQKDLADAYSVTAPEKGSEGTKEKDVYLMWGLALFLVLLLSAYDVVLQKKENFIKISLGEKISKIIFKNIGIDAAAFALAFCASLLVTSLLTYPFYLFKVSLTMLLTFIVINSLLYFSLYFYDLKKIFSNVKISKNLLSLNYVLKTVSIIVTVIVISSNLVVISEGIDYYKTYNPFFSKYKDYYYTDFYLNDNSEMSSNSAAENYLTKNQVMQETFYRKYYNQFDATAMVNCFQSMNGKNATMFANSHALDILKQNFGELNDKKLDKEIYFLIPESLKNNQAVIRNLNDIVTFFEGKSFKFSYEPIYYKGDRKVVCITQDAVGGFKIEKNPMIIYNNVDQSKRMNSIGEACSKFSFTPCIMYKLSMNEVSKFIGENGLTNGSHKVTNVYEKYEHQWNIVKKGLTLNLALSVLVLFLEVTILLAITRLEYEANSVELSIKKVLGYSKWLKNNKMILLTIASTLFGIICAAAIFMKLKIGGMQYILCTGAAVMLFDLILTVFHINKIEKSNVQKILKGGSL